MKTKKMDWTKLLTTDCYNSKKSESSDVSCDTNFECRTIFQKNIDKIIFSSHFRRLSRKTQVHPLNENDHIHSRLIHSLETACVGRSLGQYIGDFLFERKELPDNFIPEHIGQIVQAACLAHDIGNPPFGHSGEEAIKGWAKNIEQLKNIKHKKDFLSFDGNAMAFRVLVSTGYDGGERGMSPSYSVLGSLLKYPRISRHAGQKEKFSCFGSEKDVLEKVAEKLGLIGNIGNYARHPLAFLTEAADDLCYQILDLEDATELNILNSSFMLRKFKDVLEFDSNKLEKIRHECVRDRNSKIRSKIMDKAIPALVKVFEEKYDDIMIGNFNSSLFDTSNDPTIKRLREVYKEASSDIFYSRRKVELEIGLRNQLVHYLIHTLKLPMTSAMKTRLTIGKRLNHCLGQTDVQK